MATIVPLGVLLSVFLSFHAAVGHSGWTIPKTDLDHVFRSKQDHTSDVFCKYLGGLHLDPLALGSPKSVITACAVISVRAELTAALRLILVVQIRIGSGTSLFVAAQITVTADLHVGPAGFFLQACAVVDINITDGNILGLDLRATLDVRATVPVLHVLAAALCDTTSLWCKDMNYCFNFNQNPFPLPRNCIGTWKTHSPNIHGDKIQLNSRPGCTCHSADGTSSGVDLTAISPGSSYFFCGKDDLNYFLECMRRGGSFDDVFVLGSLTVGIVIDQLPQLVFSCPKTAGVVLKIECTRIYVDMQSGNTIVYVELRASIGCVLSPFVSFLDFTVVGSLFLNADVDCGRQSLLISVIARSNFVITGICPYDDDDDDCETYGQKLTGLFSLLITAAVEVRLNAVLKIGIPIPLMTHYTCDVCQKPVHTPTCLWSACTLRYHPKKP